MHYGKNNYNSYRYTTKARNNQKITELSLSINPITPKTMKKKETNTTKKTTTKKPSNRSTFPKSKENEGKLIDLELKKISLLEKQKQIADADKNKIIVNDFEHRRIKVNEDTIINSRLYYLTSIMTSLTIDTEKTILGSEPVYKSLFDEKEIHLIKAKFFETLKTL